MSPMTLVEMVTWSRASVLSTAREAQEPKLVKKGSGNSFWKGTQIRGDVGTKKLGIDKRLSKV